MNSGLLYKSFRETWLLTLICGLGILVFEMLIAYVLITYAKELTEAWASLKFALRMVSALLGTDAEKMGDPRQLIAIAWVHPVVLAMLWAHEITFCTRVPAGEIERGTSDILLGWPVSRWQVILNESLVWFASGAFLVLMGVVGNKVGESFTATTTPTPWDALPPILMNFFALYLAVGGLAWLTSALSERRGRAIAFAFAAVLISFLINFLVPFWKPAEHIAFLSVLHYYQPLAVLDGGAWPWRNTCVLAGAGLVFWLAAVGVFMRRNVATT